MAQFKSAHDEYMNFDTITAAKPRGSIDTTSFPPPTIFNMSELNLDISAEGAGYSSVECSPMTKASSNVSSFQTSPEVAHMSLFGKMGKIDSDTMASRLLSLAEPSADAEYSTDTIKPKSPLFGIATVSDDAFQNVFSHDLYAPEDFLVSTHLNDSIDSANASPAKGHKRYESFDSIYTDNSSPTMGHARYNSQNAFDSSPSSPVKGYSRSRSQAVSELDDSIEEIIENTGVTVEEINSFIGGPNENNRWTCQYPNCEKHRSGETFGRKENIKSHVQGHLEDRQYRCKHCTKTFVRQHDLKRHANIHTRKVVKTCPCGKEFARADALTRHRQRGMCSGAYEGTPKKVAKRGRPKKASRPETEERAEKAAATRQRVLERMGSASAAGSSTHTSPAMRALPMSRQESAASSQSYYSTPPELDLSSSSPAPSKTIDLPPSLGQDSVLFSPDFFWKDFTLASPAPSSDHVGLPDWTMEEGFGPGGSSKSQMPFRIDGYNETISMDDLLNDF